MQMVLVHQEKIEPTLQLVSAFFTAGLDLPSSRVSYQFKYSFFQRWGQEQYLQTNAVSGKSVLSREIGAWPDSDPQFKALFGFN